MKISYAVTWQESGEGRHSGRLELEPDGLRLEGQNGSGPATKLVRYGEIRGFYLARSPGARLQGRPTLVLELADDGQLKIASVAQPGIVAELADRLAARAEGRQAAEREAIVVPLKPGTQDLAERLLAGGPPFDPAEFGLESHEVYVTEREVIFLFNGSPATFLQHLAADDAVVRAADAWRALIDGPFRLGLRAYAWPS